MLLCHFSLHLAFHRWRVSRDSARTNKKGLTGGMLQEVFRECIASQPVLPFRCLHRRFCLTDAEDVVRHLPLQCVPALDLLREPSPRCPVPRVKWRELGFALYTAWSHILLTNLKASLIPIYSKPTHLGREWRHPTTLQALVAKLAQEVEAWRQRGWSSRTRAF